MKINRYSGKKLSRNVKYYIMYTIEECFQIVSIWQLKLNNYF